ncbi:hypothetical protein NC651_007521 [Populus alba x Populus x berolinensis]|nr:hypothetical protein NC651_007521 [Populus alba x Populus x berolinensis]
METRWIGTTRTATATTTASGRCNYTVLARVAAQKVRIYRSDRWIALKFFHEFPEAVFHGDALNLYDTETVDQYDTTRRQRQRVRRGNSTVLAKVAAQKVRIYRSKRWIALKCFHEFPEAVFHGDALNRYDTTWRQRQPAQKVRIYRSDRWIAIKFFHEFPEAVFHGDAWSRQRQASSGNSTVLTRVAAQKVRIYRSDRWIALKFFPRVSEAIFHGDTTATATTTASRSGQFHRLGQSSGSKGPYLYRSDRWIALKCFHEFPEAVFHGDELNRYDTARRQRVSVRSGPFHRLGKVAAQKVRIYRSDRWIALKCFHEFSEAVFHGDALTRYDTTWRQRLRSDPNRWIAIKFFHEFPEAVFHGYALDRVPKNNGITQSNDTCWHISQSSLSRKSLQLNPKQQCTQYSWHPNQPLIRPQQKPREPKKKAPASGNCKPAAKCG